MKLAISKLLFLAALLISQGVQAEPLTLAHLDGENADHCVSIDWVETDRPGGTASCREHWFQVDNACKRTILFKWTDDGWCGIFEENSTCAFIIRGEKKSGPGMVTCTKGGPTLNSWGAEFVL